MPKLTLSFKGRPLEVFHLSNGETLIGRDEKCEIAIDSLAVAPFHASVNVKDQSTQVEALDEDFPVLINHNPISKATLNHGDIITVGKHILSYAEDVIDIGLDHAMPAPSQEEQNQESEVEQENAVSGMLQILSGDNFGRVIPLTRNMTRIGHAGNGCAIISRRESGYHLSHLEGPNTPIVNNHSIGEETSQLSDGDIIEIGSIRMQFHN
jgi:pSer/pThr/pTyr-binding forkhead associated (FHA) protein